MFYATVGRTPETPQIEFKIEYRENSDSDKLEGCIVQATCVDRAMFKFYTRFPHGVIHSVIRERKSWGLKITYPELVGMRFTLSSKQPVTLETQTEFNY